MMKRLVVLAATAFIAFGANTASAADMTVIKYALGGVLTVLSPVVFTSAVYSPGAAAPQNVQHPTGSMVTFKFDSVGANPMVSGNVDMLSLIISQGVTIPGLATGYNWNQMIGSMTGGHLTAGGLIDGGGQIGDQYQNGFLHCTASKTACYALLGIKTYLQSYRLGRGDNTIASPVWTPNNPSTTIPLAWSGLGPATVSGPLTVNGFWQLTSLGGLYAQRPFCTATTLGDLGNGITGNCSGATGVTTLVGFEVGRTYIPMPEPTTLPLLMLGIAGAGGFAFWRRRKA